MNMFSFSVDFLPCGEEQMEEARVQSLKFGAEGRTPLSHVQEYY